MKRKFNGYWVKRPLAMMQSPAFRALSLTGHRILARIEIEHCKHNLKDNGRLPVTHEDFRRFGIHRDAIAPGIREVEALGFTEITQHGIGGNAEFRRPNMFRQTYLPTREGTREVEPTNEWTAIATVEEAEAIAAKARAHKACNGAGMQGSPAPGKRQNRPRKTGASAADFRPRFPGVKGANSRPRKTGALSRYLPISGEGCAAPAETKPQWSTPTLTEITDPDEIAKLRRLLS